MKKKGPTIFPLTAAHLAGLGAFQGAILLAIFDLRLALVPLFFFLVLCLAAPFLPRFSFYLPIVSRGRSGERAVALTFDDGPDPETTPRLLELLSRHKVTAAFFVTGQRASLHEDLIKSILSKGHAIGNHSYSHSPFLMLRSSEKLAGEIKKTQNLLNNFGIMPLAFRPPAGITNPRLWRPLLSNGMYCLNFSRRAYDAGNRRINNLAKKIVTRARPDDIILLHDTRPKKNFTVGQWLHEVEGIITGLKERGMGIRPLPDIIRRPVMRPSGPEKIAGPAETFYDSLAADYDREVRDSPLSMAHRLEFSLFMKKMPGLISGTDRVLELGAGTGIYTIPLARRCREVTAVEISSAMLEVLEKKKKTAGLSNIIARASDMEDLEFKETFDFVCSFSAFEYIPDLEGLFVKISGFLNPGGSFFFTTSHCSPFRLFTQIGNALRQGIWLHCRSARSIKKYLEKAGFSVIGITDHLFKVPVAGGMLIEVLACKKRAPGGNFFS